MFSNHHQLIIKAAMFSYHRVLSISGHLQHSFAFTCIEYVTQWSHMGKCEIIGKTVPVLVDLHAALKRVSGQHGA